MNREIKFRAWDKLDRRMIDIVGFVHHGTEIRIWYYKDGILVNESFNEDNIILMQFTGLKDKNGVEIYEGDVVQEVIIGKVEYYRNRFMCMPPKGSHFTPSEHCEVLGNIHQHKHLLKEGEGC